MRRSHTASVPEEAPVTHRCGREGCTARQLICLDSPCADPAKASIKSSVSSLRMWLIYSNLYTAPLTQQDLTRNSLTGEGTLAVKVSTCFEHDHAQGRFTCAESRAPLPVMPQDRGDLS